MPARAVAKVLLENHQKLSKAPPTAATVTAAGSDEGGKEGEQAKTAGATITETLNVFCVQRSNSWLCNRFRKLCVLFQCSHLILAIVSTQSVHTHGIAKYTP